MTTLVTTAVALEATDWDDVISAIKYRAELLHSRGGDDVQALHMADYLNRLAGRIDEQRKADA